MQAGACITSLQSLHAARANLPSDTFAKTVNSLFQGLGGPQDYGHAPNAATALPAYAPAMSVYAPALPAYGAPPGYDAALSAPSAPGKHV